MIGFASFDSVQFSRRKFERGKTFRAFSSVEIENGHRFASRVAKFAGEKQCREMIARWNIPFSCPDEDPGLLVRRDCKIPLSIFDRVWGGNKVDRGRVMFAPRLPVNRGRLRRR